MTERERLEAYVQWNQMTRHQLITAHLTLIDGTDHAQKRTAELEAQLARYRDLYSLWGEEGQTDATFAQAYERVRLADNV